MAASKAQGAPLGWNAPGPVPVTDTAVALAAKASHPHAAMLMIDFLLSLEAQTIWNQLAATFTGSVNVMVRSPVVDAAVAPFVGTVAVTPGAASIVKLKTTFASIVSGGSFES